MSCTALKIVTRSKARRWLEANNVEYRFHDYRADGLDAEFLHTAINELGWDALLNTRGTTGASWTNHCVPASRMPTAQQI